MTQCPGVPQGCASEHKATLQVYNQHAGNARPPNTRWAVCLSGFLGAFGRSVSEGAPRGAGADTCFPTDTLPGVRGEIVLQETKGREAGGAGIGEDDCSGRPGRG